MQSGSLAFAVKKEAKKYFSSQTGQRADRRGVSLRGGVQGREEAGEEAGERVLTFKAVRIVNLIILWEMLNSLFFL